VALLKVFANASDFNGERDALSWVLGIIAFECHTFRQRARRRREDVRSSAPELSADGPSPEQVVVERELEAAAHEVLGTLSPADAETLRLAARGERPLIRSATFRKRLQRALIRFRTAWSSKHGLE
jgi:DNA-directed RNA polymerase specialized sigma24 family protein